MLLIFALLLLLFGGTRLPQLGSALGQSIRNFKRGFGDNAEPEPTEQKRAPDALSSTSTTQASSTAADREKSQTRQG
ncbi:MAG TPA: twin-arginine translocase TatA/TatE family subunit [Aggregicoccus sp.]|nr:twin-arginine translocase TatA/TatE family subunit [Aggregicoccus sp.]